MQRETGTIMLPSRRPRTGAALRRGCAPPWRLWTRGAVARAERTADGRVHLVVLRAARTGVMVSATGVGAAQAESLAPIAARVRRALARPDGSLRGTSAFEDAVRSLLDEHGASSRANRAVFRLGDRCPAAPSLRTMPEPGSVLARTRVDLARAVGSIDLARRLQALARAFVAMTPAPPTRP